MGRPGVFSWGVQWNPVTNEILVADYLHFNEASLLSTKLNLIIHPTGSLNVFITELVKSGKFRPIFRIFFVLLMVDAVVLGIVGAKPPEGIWLVVGRVLDRLIRP